ncbi:MAG: mechanosensitive ion channel family protein [Myxococcota bacterium]|jgi:small-conductance mechanosensitive channel|nr:mechanosensitive ion channel family protein [Myxococcota bacterium]
MLTYFLEPFYFLFGGLCIGLFVQKWVIVRIHRIAQRTHWKWDDIIVNSLGNMPLIWCVFAGAYGYLWYSPIALEDKDLVQKGFISILIFTLTIVCARLATGSVEHLSGKSKSKLPTTTLFTNGAKVLIYILGVILILQNLEIKITPVITALGIGGLAVALALEETLNNLFSGVQIIASQLVRPGDYVKLDAGYEGYVTDIKARSTTIRAYPENNRIIVPNRILASSIVINYSLPEKNLWVDLSVGVAYDSDLERVEEVTLEVAQEICQGLEGASAEHKPVLRYEEFADSSINFRVRMYVDAFQDQFMIKHAFIKALHKRFNTEGIEIPFPIRTLYMKNEKS